jgi:molybdopterin-guanine dinucleotide biosynthesis protein A
VVEQIGPQDITAVVLAGGRGLRMGGVDKGLQPFKGQTLVGHILQRLQQGQAASAFIINANRHIAQYQHFGVPVWPDEPDDHAGPLAGFLTGLSHSNTPWLLTTPCDTPLLPLDLAVRLSLAAQTQAADIAMASAPQADRSGQTMLRAQPVFCLLRTRLRASLVHFMQNGGRKIDAWTAQHKTVLVPFDRPSDDPWAFFNANTLAELQNLETKLP